MPPDRIHKIFVNFRKLAHTSTPVASTTHLTFLKNLTNKHGSEHGFTDRRFYFYCPVPFLGKSNSHSFPLPHFPPLPLFRVRESHQISPTAQAEESVILLLIKNLSGAVSYLNGSRDTAFYFLQPVRSTTCPNLHASFSWTELVDDHLQVPTVWHFWLICQCSSNPPS